MVFGGGGGGGGGGGEQVIVAQRLFGCPKRGAAVRSEAIESADFRKGPQFIFVEGGAPFEVVHRCAPAGGWRLPRGRRLRQVARQRASVG